jgi:hypothetical protein
MITSPWNIHYCCSFDSDRAGHFQLVSNHSRCCKNPRDISKTHTLVVYTQRYRLRAMINTFWSTICTVYPACIGGVDQLEFYVGIMLVCTVHRDFSVFVSPEHRRGASVMLVDEEESLKTKLQGKGPVTLHTQEPEPEVIQLDGKGSPMSSIGNSTTSGNTSKSLVQKACIELSTEISAEHNKIVQGKDKENQQDQLLALTIEEEARVANFEKLEADMKAALEKENEEKMEVEKKKLERELRETMEAVIRKQIESEMKQAADKIKATDNITPSKIGGSNRIPETPEVAATPEAATRTDQDNTSHGEDAGPAAQDSSDDDLDIANNYNNTQSNYMNIHDPTDNLDVRAFFWNDLEPFFRQCIEDGDQIILTGDFNSEFKKVREWMLELGLVKGICEKHGYDEAPNTYQRSKKSPIDGIFVSPHLRASAARYLSFGKLMGDHRGLWMDFPVELLFGYNPPSSNFSGARRLKLSDPRVVERYTALLHEACEEHNLYQRMHNLHTHSGFPHAPQDATGSMK